MNQKDNLIKSLFIFSLPRSGSTLLQRVLSSDQSIASVSEPWLLLPLFYAIKAEGTYSEYSHQNSVVAIEELVNTLPDGKDDYYRHVKSLVESLYRHTITDESAPQYFLDKTPRYALICDEVIHTFDDAKFIFLWRNPLAVMSSMIDTWCDGQWKLYHFKIDLFKGMEKLLSTYDQNKSSVLSINYEEFVEHPNKQIERIGEYLGLELNTVASDNISSVLMKGEMGDSTGVRKYQSISSDSIDSWKSTICNPLRKRWCKNYLNWLGPKRLKLIGYDYVDLMKQLNDLPFGFKHLFNDVLYSVYGVIYSFFSLHIIRDKIRSDDIWKNHIGYS